MGSKASRASHSPAQGGTTPGRKRPSESGSSPRLVQRRRYRGRGRWATFMGPQQEDRSSLQPVDDRTGHQGLPLGANSSISARAVLG